VQGITQGDEGYSRSGNTDIDMEISFAGLAVGLDLANQIILSYEDPISSQLTDIR